MKPLSFFVKYILLPCPSSFGRQEALENHYSELDLLYRKPLPMERVEEKHCNIKNEKIGGLLRRLAECLRSDRRWSPQGGTLRGA